MVVTAMEAVVAMGRIFHGGIIHIGGAGTMRMVVRFGAFQKGDATGDVLEGGEGIEGTVHGGGGMMALVVGLFGFLGWFVGQCFGRGRHWSDLDVSALAIVVIGDASVVGEILCLSHGNVDAEVGGFGFATGWQRHDEFRFQSKKMIRGETVVRCSSRIRNNLIKLTTPTTDEIALMIGGLVVDWVSRLFVPGMFVFVEVSLRAPRSTCSVSVSLRSSKRVTEEFVETNITSTSGF